MKTTAEKIAMICPMKIQLHKPGIAAIRTNQNSSFAAAIFHRYAAGDEYGLPTASFVFFDPDEQDEQQDNRLRSAVNLLMTVNRMEYQDYHFVMNHIWKQHMLDQVNVYLQEAAGNVRTEYRMVAELYQRLEKEWTGAASTEKTRERMEEREKILKIIQKQLDVNITRSQGTVERPVGLIVSRRWQNLILADGIQKAARLPDYHEIWKQSVTQLHPAAADQLTEYLDSLEIEEKRQVLNIFGLDEKTYHRELRSMKELRWKMVRESARRELTKIKDGRTTVIHFLEDRSDLKEIQEFWKIAAEMEVVSPGSMSLGAMLLEAKQNLKQLETVISDSGNIDEIRQLELLKQEKTTAVSWINAISESQWQNFRKQLVTIEKDRRSERVWERLRVVLNERVAMEAGQDLEQKTLLREQHQQLVEWLQYLEPEQWDHFVSMILSEPTSYLVSKAGTRKEASNGTRRENILIGRLRNLLVKDGMDTIEMYSRQTVSRRLQYKQEITQILEQERETKQLEELISMVLDDMVLKKTAREWLTEQEPERQPASNGETDSLPVWKETLYHIVEEENSQTELQELIRLVNQETSSEREEAVLREHRQQLVEWLQYLEPEPWDHFVSMIMAEPASHLVSEAGTRKEVLNETQRENILIRRLKTLLVKGGMDSMEMYSRQSVSRRLQYKQEITQILEQERETKQLEELISRVLDDTVLKKTAREWLTVQETEQTVRDMTMPEVREEAVQLLNQLSPEGWNHLIQRLEINKTVNEETDTWRQTELRELMYQMTAEEPEDSHTQEILQLAEQEIVSVENQKELIQERQQLVEWLQYLEPESWDHFVNLILAEQLDENYDENGLWKSGSYITERITTGRNRTGKSGIGKTGTGRTEAGKARTGESAAGKAASGETETGWAEEGFLESRRKNRIGSLTQRLREALVQKGLETAEAYSRQSPAERLQYKTEMIYLLEKENSYQQLQELIWSVRQDEVLKASAKEWLSYELAEKHSKVDQTVVKDVQHETSQRAINWIRGTEPESWDQFINMILVEPPKGWKPLIEQTGKGSNAAMLYAGSIGENRNIYDSRVDNKTAFFYNPATMVVSRMKNQTSPVPPPAPPVQAEIETQVVKKVKEELSDIQFVSHKKTFTTVSSEYEKQVTTLREQVELQHKELEQMKEMQSRLIKLTDTGRLTDSVLKQLGSQLKIEKMRRGL